MSRIDIIEAGWYWTRQVRGGPRMAARIWWGFPTWMTEEETTDRQPAWNAEVDGQPHDDVDGLWVWVADKKIDQAEYDYLLARSHHARTWDPSMPEADPKKPIDLNRAKPPF